MTFLTILEKFMETNTNNEATKETNQHKHHHGGCCGMPMHGGQISLWNKWILYGFLAIAAFYLWTEHRAHLLGYLPYLLFLACPLMHLFHGQHHKHHHSTDTKNDVEQQGA